MTKLAFSNEGNAEKSKGAFAYMKGIAPFIGISAQQRRALTSLAWNDMPPPTSSQLGKAAILLFRCKEREFHYAAYDLIHKWFVHADEYFLDEYVKQLITTKSWWDTVDGLVNAAVSPLCFKFDSELIIDEWSGSRNIWLIRSAIGHQRGWKQNTEIERVFELCDRHWANSEFFIAKAIGWALRDIARMEPKAVKRFLKEHPNRNLVAEREAKRGIENALQRFS